MALRLGASLDECAFDKRSDGAAAGPQEREADRGHRGNPHRAELRGRPHGGVAGSKQPTEGDQPRAEHSHVGHYTDEELTERLAPVGRVPVRARHTQGAGAAPRHEERQ